MQESHHTWKKLFLLVTVGSTFVYIAWRGIYTIPLGFGFATLFFGLWLFIAEAIAGLEVFLHYWQSIKEKKLELPEIPEEWYPPVDVIITTHNEPPELVRKTANACKHLDYPDKSKVHVYIADDMNRREMEHMAANLGVGYIGLDPAENKHAKAGNLNNALSKTASPLILTVDADMIVRRHMLLGTVPYFFLPKLKKVDGQWVPRKDATDEKIGFIQTPQSFYNTDMFQHNLYLEDRLPNEQDYFFREVNTSRNIFNAAIHAGSNAVISREAIEEVGGIATNTITEDYETGLRIQAKGYTTYAIAEPLANGLAPTSIRSMLTQRERWGRGCVQSLKNVRLLTNMKIPFKLKIGYFSTLLYWWTFFRRFIYILAPIVFTLFHVQVIDANFYHLLFFWGSNFLLRLKATSIISGRIRNQHTSNVVDTILFPYMILPLLLESVGIRQKKFAVTSKVFDRYKAKTWTFALPHAILLVASVAGIIVCITHIIFTQTYYIGIVLFWLIVNSKNLLFAILFMFSRENFRSTERFRVKAPISVSYKEKTFEGETVDITDHGISFTLLRPEYLPGDETFAAEITDELYGCSMMVKVLHVSQKGELWKYIVSIEEIDDENLSRYYQFIYDREHCHPKFTHSSSTIYTDLASNFSRRAKKQQLSMRELPRINTNAPFRIAGGAKGTIIDFNYRYASIVFRKEPAYLNKSFMLPLGGGLELHLKLYDSRVRWNGGLLFTVLNWQQIVQDKRLARIIDSWTQKTFTSGFMDLEVQKTESDTREELDELDRKLVGLSI